MKVILFCHLKLKKKDKIALFFFHSISFHNIPLSAEISSFRKFMGELRGKKSRACERKKYKVDGREKNAGGKLEKVFRRYLLIPRSKVNKKI